MPRKFFNDGQELIQQDFSAISSSLEMELYDRILYEMMNRQQNVVFGDSLIASYVNATTSQVKKGNGVYYDNTQVDPEPMTRLFNVAANTNVTHTAAHATLNRYDIICAKADRATAASQSRNYKDPSTGAISSVSMVVETDWVTTLVVTAGTPNASPAVPATPAGYIKLAEVLITAAVGISGAGAYTDKRSRFQKRSSWLGVATPTATYAVDIDDEVILANATGGAFPVNLPAASLCTGKTLKVFKSDSSGNAVTVTAAGSDLIVGSATQVLNVQFQSLNLFCDGSSWYII